MHFQCPACKEQFPWESHRDPGFCPWCGVNYGMSHLPEVVEEEDDDEEEDDE